MGRPFSSLGLVPLLLGLGTSVASADPARARLVVVGSVVAKDDASVSGIEIASAASQIASYILERELVPPAELVGNTDERLRACGAEPRCLSGVLEELGASELVWLVLNQRSDPALFTGRVLNARGETLASIVSELEVGEARPERVVKEAKELLLRAGLKLGGKLVLELRPPGALVDLEGPGGEHGPPKSVLEPGRYAILVAHEGYTSRRESFEVASGADSTLALTLEEEGSLSSSPWLWIGIGVGVAAVAAGTLALVAATSGGDGLVLCVDKGHPERCE